MLKFIAKNLFVFIFLSNFIFFQNTLAMSDDESSSSDHEETFYDAPNQENSLKDLSIKPVKKIFQDALMPIYLEDLPAEIIFLFLQNLIINSERSSSAIKNIVSFALTCKKNKNIVEKNGKGLICFLLLNEEFKSLLKKIATGKAIPKILDKGLFKILKDKKKIKILTDYLQISNSDLKFLILVIATRSNYMNFFQALFEQRDLENILYTDAISDVLKLATVMQKNRLLKFISEKGFHLPEKNNNQNQSFIKMVINYKPELEQQIAKFDEKNWDLTKNNLSIVELFLSTFGSMEEVSNSDLLAIFKIYLNYFYSMVDNSSQLDFNKFSFEEKIGIYLHISRNNVEIQLIPYILDNLETSKNQIDDQGNTFLIIACAWNDIDLVKLLLNIRVQIDATDNNGNTALIVAAQINSTDITRLLLEAGADPRILNTAGFNALFFATANGNQEIIQLLQNAENRKNKFKYCNVF